MPLDARFERAKGAVLSRDRRYRYALWRRWEPARPWVLFIGLNPSTADASRDDPTIRRCIGFARDWHAGGVLVGNLFAWRSTDPAGLREADDPLGPANRRWLARLSGAADRVVACWGNPGNASRQARWVTSRIAGLEALAVNRRGAPRHPLYVPKGTRPRGWPDDVDQSRGSSASSITSASSRPRSAG